MSFGTAWRRGDFIPATLSKALARPYLVYPLVSLDISGQWPLSHADASPNEGFEPFGSFEPTVHFYFVVIVVPQKGKVNGLGDRFKPGENGV